MTNSHQRRRAPRLPDFKPVENLRPGDPFNPYAVYFSWSVAHELGRFAKLRPAAKWVWHILAVECYSSGYDSHAQAQLAFYAGLSVDQFQYHLTRLKTLRLVHVEAELGRQNCHWMLYHPIFASCSLMTPGKTPVGLPENSGTYLPENSGTQSTYKSTYRDTGTPGIYKGTSSRGSDAQNGEAKAKASENGNGAGSGSYNGESVNPASLRVSPQNADQARPFDEPRTPLLKANARRSWNTLEKQAQANRFENACRVAKRIEYFRALLSDGDGATRHGARLEMDRALTELGDAGFYLP